MQSPGGSRKVQATANPAKIKADTVRAAVQAMLLTGKSASSGTASALSPGATINGVLFTGAAPITITAAAPHALTLGTGLSGTSYDGSAAVTATVTGAPWSGITGTPTTLGGYGITDAYTKTASDARYAPIAGPFAAEDVAAGTFGANVGGGNYVFPGALTTGGLSPVGAGLQGHIATGRNYAFITDASQLGSSGVAVGSFNDTFSAYAPLSIVASALLTNAPVHCQSTLEVDSDFSVATNKFTVDHTTGNTVVAGTLTTDSGSIFSDGSGNLDVGTLLVGPAGTAATLDGAGNVKIKKVGGGYYGKEGTNATLGVATLSSGTVTVATTKVTANSRIFVSRQDDPSSLGVLACDVVSRVIGTSFTIKSANVIDSATVAWLIVEPA